MKAVNEEESIEHFKILLEETEKHNFVHYEISNFAKEGFYSKHNSIYWLGGSYAGFGPSSHSFNGKSRQWNVANMKQYIGADTVEEVVLEKEVLNIDQQFNEYVMTSLRTSWGCDVKHIENVFGEQYSKHFSQSAHKYIVGKKLYRKGSTYTLTAQGKLFADGIAADLFL
jgi:oxygen-independent coproporphyrinogen-3 oxidase